MQLGLESLGLSRVGGSGGQLTVSERRGPAHRLASGDRGQRGQSKELAARGRGRAGSPVRRGSASAWPWASGSAE
eukprot:5724203-Prymnesium_polylepis.3